MGELLHHLRAGTRDLHAAVEARLRLPHGIVDADDLAAVLGAMMQAWEGWEQALAARADWGGLGLDNRLGHAVHLLRRDLAVLGGERRPPARVDAGIGLSEAVGVRYVLLGSALGGAVTAPVLEARLGLDGGAGTAFLRRDGLHPGRDWQQFRRAVTAHARALDPSAALAGARATFASVLAAAGGP